jgi:hypothetical protein
MIVTEDRRQTPAAPEAESAVIGLMLADPLAITVAREENHLQPREFQEVRHARICEAVYRVLDSGAPVDVVTVLGHLRRHGHIETVGGDVYVKMLAARDAAPDNIAHYVGEIKAAAAKRWSLARFEEGKAMSLNGVSVPEIAKFIRDTGEELQRLTTDATAPPRARFELISAPAFKNRQPPEYLIEDLLVENTLSAIVGPSGTYKSFIAISIAACVATGMPWHGHEVRQAPVVYISGEGSAGLGARGRAWEIKNGIFLPECLYFLPQAVQVHNPLDITELVSAIRALPEAPGLIIIDTLARCLVGGDENSAKDMGLFVAGADRLRTETGAHVNIIHHFGKSGDTRGSTALPGALDTMIGVERSKDNFLTLSCMKQKDAEEFAPMGFTRHVQELTEDGSETSLVFEPAEMKVVGSTAKMQAMIDLLARSEKGMKSGEWQTACEAIDVKRSTFFNYRNELVQSGRVLKVMGAYIVASAE